MLALVSVFCLPLSPAGLFFLVLALISVLCLPPSPTGLFFLVLALIWVLCLPLSPTGLFFLVLALISVLCLPLSPTGLFFPVLALIEVLCLPLSPSGLFFLVLVLISVWCLPLTNWFCLMFALMWSLCLPLLSGLFVLYLCKSLLIFSDRSVQTFVLISVVIFFFWLHQHCLVFVSLPVLFCKISLACLTNYPVSLWQKLPCLMLGFSVSPRLVNLVCLTDCFDLHPSISGTVLPCVLFLCHSCCIDSSLFVW